MTSFLTLEDVNTSNVSNYINEYYVLDTSLIGTDEFSGVLFDFCIVTHQINGNNHIFTFEIHNSLWTGGYYFTKKDGSFLDVAGNYSDEILTLNIAEPNVVLHLYLCSFAPSFNLRRLDAIFIDDENSGIYTLPNNKIRRNMNLTIQLLRQNDVQIVDFPPNSFGIFNAVQFYLLFLLNKKEVLFAIEQEGKVGIINKIRLNVDRDFLPGGSLVSAELLNIFIKYEDEIIPVYFDEDLEDYCFDLDLTEKTDNKDIKLQILVNETDLINPGVFDFNLSCNYPYASNFEELQSNIVAGSKIIELIDDITFTSSLIIPNDVYLICNENNVFLNNFNILISNNIVVKIDKGIFNNGESCFVQQNNSKLILNNCKFINSIIADNFKGSVITANYNEVTSELNNCVFINCHHTIYHGGNLAVNNCRALFNSYDDNIDTDYPAFLTAYEGTVSLTNNVFDIDYDVNTLCSNEIDIKFAQALVGLGENTLFNGIYANRLGNNESLPIFGNPYNNKSHLFARYYYPQIEDCVISSPVLGKEDESCCHMILGTDWVYKNNVIISRNNWKSENKIRTFNWEDV